MLNDKYISLFTDFGFKKIFGNDQNKDILIHFLNTLLEREHDPILNVKYLKNDWQSKTEKERIAIFDLHCETTKNDIFIVEMQCVKQVYFKDRSVYYASFPIQEKGKKGKWDYKLPPVYVVSIMNFTFDDDINDWDKVISHVKLMDTQTKEIFYDKLTFVYIEMPKFTKKSNELESILDKWLYVLKNMDKLDKIPKEASEQIFLKLFLQCEIAKYNPQERDMYEESWKRANDWYAILETAKIESETVGEARGEARNEIRKNQEIIINGIEEGLSNEVLSKLTKLSIAEIENIRKELGI